VDTKHYEYTHLELNREITAIGGHYIIRKEVRLPFHNKELLYVVADALFDTTCCGFGGLRYAHVPGFITAWKHDRDRLGRFISTVRPVESDQERSEIKRIIEKAEQVSQVNFT